MYHVQLRYDNSLINEDDDDDDDDEHWKANYNGVTSRTSRLV